MPSGQRTILATLLGLALTVLLMVGVGWLTTPAPSERLTLATAHQVRKRPRRMRTHIYRQRPSNRASAPQLAQTTPRRDPLRDKEKKKKKKKKPEDKLTGQIVETARPKSEEAPKVAKYLGRYDMKVKVEQKSRGHKRKSADLGTKKIANPSKLQSPQSDSTAPTVVQTAKRVKKKRRKRRKKRAKSAQKRLASGQAAKTPGPKPTTSTAAPRAGPGALAAGGDPTPKRRQPSVLRGAHSDMLLPSTSAGNIMHNLQALAGSPGSDDYLPDVDNEGDTNLLNTRKFRYWDFFQRVRKRVRSEWNPAGAWRSRDPTGKRYGVRDRLTVVRVKLQPDGKLADIRIQKRSGLGFLDDEARRAFVAAGPYPNPPRGLVNRSGVVEFKFGFMFEISSSRFKFYRMNR